MTQFDSSPRRNGFPPDVWLSEPTSLESTPPIGTTPPSVLALQAAEGQRGAAWRLLSLIIENDPRAVEAVVSFEDDRLAEHLLECIALGTWAGKAFVIPPLLRSSFARMRLHTLFVPPAGIARERSERVLLAAARDERVSMRETAIYILGLLDSTAAVPVLLQALHDPHAPVRFQAVRALGRTGNLAAVPALIEALAGADERLSNQIFRALVNLGHIAVPALIELAASRSGRIRWHSINVLSTLRDPRALPVLVEALKDGDHAVAWMAAKGLAPFGRECIEPVLHMLTTTDITPWIVETVSYVLRVQCQAHNELKPYLEPLLQEMHQTGFREGTAYTALKTLEQLRASGLLKLY